MIEILKNFPDNVIALSCEGQVTKEDYDGILVPAILKAGTGDRAGASGLVPAADRACDGSSSRDGGRLSEVVRDRDSIAGKLGREVSGKSGHLGDHRLGQIKTGHRSDHRLWRSTTGQQPKSGHFSDHRLFALGGSFGAGQPALGQHQ